MRRPRPWAAVVVATLAVLGLLLAAGAPAALRLPVALWFLLVCPGMALVPLLGARSRLAELGVGIGASIAIDALVGLFLVYSGLGITPWTTFASLGLVCLAGAGLQTAGDARRAQARIWITAGLPRGAVGSPPKSTTSETSHAGSSRKT